MKVTEKTDNSWVEPTKPENANKPAETKENKVFLDLKPRRDEKDQSKFIPWHIRLVANPIRFRQHFYKLFFGCNFTNGYEVRSGVVSPAWSVEEKDLDIVWTKGDYLPSKQFAAPFLVRELGEIRLVQAGPDVFDPIEAWQAASDINPSSNDGCDFLVTVKEVKGKDGKAKREYLCQADPKNMRTPFTAEELAMIEAYPEDWTKYWKKQTPEEMEHLWNQLPEERKYNKNSKRLNKGPSFAERAAAANKVGKAATAPQATQQPVAQPAQQPVQPAQSAAPAAAAASDMPF